MIERSTYLPDIGFSSQADWDTLLSLIDDKVVEITLHDGTSHIGVLGYSRKVNYAALWAEVDTGFVRELVAVVEDFDTIASVVVL